MFKKLALGKLFLRGCGGPSSSLHYHQDDGWDQMMEAAALKSMVVYAKYHLIRFKEQRGRI
ncbi:hypothetical protein BDA96_02G169600 [Sorghum bicolor]|uniref:Uncharacterized protein n=1 Tax=Sorghum bicolor TaxID=4558 RepID=A0A921RNX5_SORBI|nr:hypothetical protein BDA96_02G169600 [Sorghum bicolor]